MSSGKVEAVAEYYHAGNKTNILDWVDSPHIQYKRGVRHILELRVISVSADDEDIFEELIDKLAESPGTVRHLNAPNIKCSRRLVRKIARMLAVNNKLAFITISLDKDDTPAHMTLAKAIIKNPVLEEIMINPNEEYNDGTIITAFYNVISRRIRPDVFKLYLGKRELFTERLDLIHSRALPDILARSTSDTIDMNMSNFVTIDTKCGAVIAQQIVKNTHRGFVLRGGRITLAALTQIARAMSATRSVAILRLNADGTSTERQQIIDLFEKAFLKNPFLARGSRWYLFDDKTNYFAHFLRKHPLPLDSLFEVPD